MSIAIDFENNTISSSHPPIDVQTGKPIKIGEPNDISKILIESDEKNPCSLTIDFKREGL